MGIKRGVGWNGMGEDNGGENRRGRRHEGITLEE
jgi:hypothetical protein